MKQEYRQSGSGYREGLSGFAYTRQIICFRKENKADNQVNLPEKYIPRFARTQKKSVILNSLSCKRPSQPFRISER